MIAKFLQKVWHSASGWSAIAVLGRLGNSLLLLPAIVMYLKSDDLGVWYMLTASGALCMALDIGLGATVQRTTAAYVAGADYVPHEGAPAFSGKSVPNLPYLFAVYRKALACYFTLSIIVPTVAFIGATFGGLLPRAQLGAALIYHIGIALYILGAFQANALIGVGMIRKSQQIVAVCSLVGSAASVVCLLCWRDLGAVCLGFAFGGAIALFWSERIRRNTLLRDALSHGDALPFIRIADLFLASWKMGALMVASAAFTSANTWIVRARFDLHAVAQYGLTASALGLVGSLSGVLVTSAFPDFVRFRVQGRTDELLRSFGWRLVGGGVAFALGSTVIALYGSNILRLLGSHTVLVACPVVAVMGVAKLLETNQTSFAYVLLSENAVPFLVPVILSSAIGITVNIIFPHASMLQFVLVSLATQLVWINWWLPVRGASSLNCELPKIYAIGFQELLRGTR